MTFAATANAVVHAGARPVLADVDPRTMCLDPEDVRRRITERTHMIVPVHFAAGPCDLGSLLALAREHDLRIVEDCAHAIETLYDGRHFGCFGEMGTFSFYVTRNLVTGGMLVTSEEAQAARAKSLALHGLSADAWKRFSDEGSPTSRWSSPGSSTTDDGVHPLPRCRHPRGSRAGRLVALRRCGPGSGAHRRRERRPARRARGYVAQTRPARAWRRSKRSAA
jgi:dTDP-4-amino-4,6-dideoxygalactose transaminase